MNLLRSSIQSESNGMIHYLFTLTNIIGSMLSTAFPEITDFILQNGFLDLCYSQIRFMNDYFKGELIPEILWSLSNIATDTEENI